MEKLAIGIDIGGTNTVIGLVNRAGKILAEESFPTPSKKLNAQGSEEISKELLKDYIKGIANTIKLLSSQLKVDSEIVGIGIGAPNGNYHKGTIEYAPNLPFSGVVSFCELLGAEFPKVETIRLTNDANAAALGEKMYGGARHMDDFVMFTLGTGVGSGLYSNGNLVYGFDGFAGECGHNTIVENGRVCGCGGRGHLEAYCSAPGMKRTAFELLADYHDETSELAGYAYRDLTSKHIYDAAVKGDKIAKKVFEYTGNYLGQAIADTVNHFSPEAVFLFGGPVAAGDILFQPIKKSLQAHLLPVFQKRNIPVMASELDLGHAAILGASALVWQALN
ncbi:ROK family protein [Puteibacter caeruleilacunae]|nr:ROK family protein [Puteibacter caeruleilacunae]